MEDTQTIEPPQQQDPPIKKLYNGLYADGKYTKSFDEFKKKYSTPEAIDRLYTELREDNDYTKSKAEFQQQYFTEVKKKDIGSKSGVTPSVNGLSGTPKVEATAAPKSTQYLEASWATPAKASTLKEAQVTDMNLLGNLWNSFTTGIGRLGATGVDVAAQVLNKILPSEEGITDEQRLKKLRENVVEPTRTATTELVGANVTPKQKERFEKNMVASTAGSLVEMIPAMGGKGLGLLLQAYDHGMESINSTKEGRALPENVKTVFSGTVGAVVGAMDRLSLTKIFGKQSNKIAANVAIKVLTKLVKETDKPITAEITKLAIMAELKSLKKVALNSGKKLTKAVATESVTEGAQELATIVGEKILNKTQGQEIFHNDSWKENLDRVAQAAMQGAVGGGLLGTVALPFNKSRDYISEKVSNATSQQDIDDLKNQLMGLSRDENLSDVERQHLSETIDNYIRVNQAVPLLTPNRKEVVDKIVEREEVQTEIDNKKAELETVDVAFKKDVEQEIELLEKKAEEINKELSEPEKITPEIASNEGTTGTSTEVNQPVLTDTEQPKGQEAETGLPSGAEPNSGGRAETTTPVSGKRIIEPSKPVSEMNSDELYNHAVETRKALNKQDKEFENKTEQEKNDAGYYDIIDNVEDLRDAAQRVNFVENSENINELAKSVKSVLTNFDKNNPSETTLAVLNAAKKKAVELGVNANDLIKEVLKTVGEDFKDKDDAEFMMRNAMEKITGVKSEPVSKPSTIKGEEVNPDLKEDFDAIVGDIDKVNKSTGQLVNTEEFNNELKADRDMMISNPIGYVDKQIAELKNKKQGVLDLKESAAFETPEEKADYIKRIFDNEIERYETIKSKLQSKSENKPIQNQQTIEYEDLPQNVKDIVDKYGDDNDKTTFNNKLAEAGYGTEYDMESFGEESGVSFYKLPENEKTKAAKVSKPTEKEGTANEPTNKVEQPTEEGIGGKEPPKEPTVDESKSGDKFREKGILNRLFKAEKTPAQAKKGFEEKGLKYEPQTNQEAEQIGKAMVDEYGIDDAVVLAETAKFKGGVNSAIFAESLNRIFKEEQDAKTPEAKLEAAKRFAEVGIRYDEFARGQGRDISQIGHFYKKSPLGIKMMEEAKKREAFDEFAKKKEQSWKEFFDEMQKDPEFEKEFKNKVSEELKKERAEARKSRIAKVDKFFDDAIDKLKKGGAAYSTVIPVSPKVLAAALEGMKKAYHAGEKIAKLVEDAIDYISKESGGGWDKEKFRKEWNERLGEHEAVKEIPADKREKMLDRFRKKLKGLSEKEKDEVIRRSFKKLVENGALEYADFKKIIGDVLGYGEMTTEQAQKLVSLVEDINKVDDMATALRESNRTEKALNEYLAAKKKAETSATELGKLVFDGPKILQRLLSVMQLNTLGIPSLVNNPIFNIANQSTVRLPRSLIMTGLDFGIQKIGKAFGKDIDMQNNVFAGQAEFWRKLGYGSRQSVQQLVTGLTNSDYFQKEVRTSQIHPVTSMKELWAFSQGEIKLTPKQVIDKTIQATVGVPAEVVARVLNIGDKPQRFAAEGAQAATFSKNLGLQGIDHKLFMEFPKEEAYRAFKKQGMSDEAAMKKAEEIQQRIIKEGEESVFQEDNLLNDMINGAFEAAKKGGKAAYGFGQIVKTLNMPFLKIPLNAYWSTFNLANPEVAFVQSMVYAAKAIKTKSPLDIQQSKKWFAHGVTGLAWMGVTGALASSGIINAGNADDTTKKEREGEQFYENQNTINMGKFQALIEGKDPSQVKDGLLVDLKWLGNMGILMGYQARKLENLTPEQKQNGTDLMEDMFANMKESAIDFADKGVFANTGSMIQAIDKGGSFMDSYMLNLINMGTNILQPAAFAQMSRAQLPYYSKVKADSFQEEIANSLLARSSVLRALNNKYPPSKISIWGDTLDKKDNWGMRLFGISRQNDDNFAQVLYNDYKKTNDTRFFPPTIKPSIKDGDKTVKLTPKETAELEILVGQERKKLVAPYTNDMARFEGSDKRYSQLSNDEKIKNLNILYQTGYEAGEWKFLQRHPQYKAAPKTDEQIQKEQEMEMSNKQLRAESKEKAGISDKRE